MNTARQNFYRDIHKAVRALLTTLLAETARTDFADAAELAALRTRVDRDFHLLLAHAHHEHTFIDPVLRELAPGLAGELSCAHDAQHVTMAELQAALARVRPASPGVLSQADAFGADLSRFVAEQLVHMADEEQRAMPLLQAAYSDAELEELHQRILGSIAPDEHMAWFGLMLPSLPVSAAAGLLEGVRLGAPREVYAAVLELAARVMPESAFAAVTRRLDRAA
jgi:Hemerythrin HHE cation binding domain